MTVVLAVQYYHSHNQHQWNEDKEGNQFPRDPVFFINISVHPSISPLTSISTPSLFFHSPSSSCMRACMEHLSNGHALQKRRGGCILLPQHSYRPNMQSVDIPVGNE